MNQGKTLEEKIKRALENLENKYHCKDGYHVNQILDELNDDISEKQIRSICRSLICKKYYPEFATAGNEDLVYSPNGKFSGFYRLSKYRSKVETERLKAKIKKG